ncbi:MAG TPA: hypothetical protein VMT52_02800, partial [Planctomycetota bacterium]|nr:hypothetical protein [Planctomycetota bacterium]
KLFPKEFLHRHKIFPFDKVGDMLLLMVTEIPSDNALAEIPKLTKLNAGLYIGYGSEINTMLLKLVPLTTGAPQGAGAAGAKGAKGAKPAKAAAVVMEATDEDEDPEGSTLVFGASQKTFLAELDSTWDSIFDQVTGKEDTKQKD